MIKRVLSAIALLLLCSIANADRLLDAMPRTMHAKNFTLPYSTGGMFNLDDLKGKFVLVSFWSTRCASCLAELTFLQDLREQFADENVLEIVAVHAGPEVEAVNKQLELSPVSYSVVMDLNLELGHWGIPSLPTSYLLTPDGDFAYRAVGARAWNSPQMVKFLRVIIADYEENKPSEQ